MNAMGSKLVCGREATRLSPRARRLASLLFLAFMLACSKAPEEHADAHSDHEDEHERPDAISLTPEAYEVAAITVAPVVPRIVAPTVQVTGTLSYDERRMAIAPGLIAAGVAALGIGAGLAAHRRRQSAKGGRIPLPKRRGGSGRKRKR